MRQFSLRLSKREKYVFYILIAVLIAVFFDRVILRQVMDRLSKLNSEILIQEKKLQKSLYILSQENSITKEHEKYTKHVQQTRSDEEERAGLLSEIEKLARKSSVFLADIKPSLTEKTEPYKKYTVELKIESEIGYIIDFIYQLEKSPRLFRVKDFHLTPKEKKSATLKGRMTITEILIISEEDASKDAS